MHETVLSLQRLSKVFGSVKAVDGVSLDVRRGETVSLLGPSGCGKTTTLRMVAGLERPTAGDIIHQGRPIVSVAQRVYVPPDKRNIGLVFQSYALWPHMTVRENVGYPLRVRHVKANLAKARVFDVLELVGLQGLADAPVSNLSGGQQQRVALARALVYEPSLLLLDEPFSNLDARLRAQMRLEVKLLKKRLHMTTLFVTHDQIEALSVADRVAVMSHGTIEQIDSPVTVYEHPATRFVRDFLGKIVALRCVVDAIDASGRVALRLLTYPETVFRAGCDGSLRLSAGDEVEVAIRPEHVRLGSDGLGPHEENVVSGVIEALLFTGTCYESQIRIGTETIVMDLPRPQRWQEGQAIALQLPAAHITLWPLQVRREHLVAELAGRP